MGRGLMIGAAIGAGLALLLTVAGTIAFTTEQVAKMRRGWNLVPLVATSRALKRGAPLAAGDLVSREEVEQFATDNSLKPDDLTRVTQRIVAADLPAGALVYWNDLEPEQPTSVEQCVRAAAVAK